MHPYGVGDDTREWWSIFINIYKFVSKKFKCVICGLDTNATFCEESLPERGCVGLAKLRKHVTSNAGFVAEKLRECKSFVPSTFERFCEESFVCNPYTYTCKNGSNSSVIDYVMCSNSVEAIRTSCRLMPQLALIHSANDHHAVAIDLKPCCDMHDPVFERRVAKYDRSRVGEPAADLVFSQFMKEMPVVPFGVDVATHLDILDKHVEQACCEAYPRVKRFKHDFLIESTKSEINRHSVSVKKMRKQDRRILDIRLHIVFCVWKYEGFVVRWSVVFGFLSLHSLKQFREARQEADRCSAVVKAHVHLDFLVAASESAEALVESVECGNAKHMHEGVKKVAKICRYKSSRTVRVAEIICNVSIPSCNMRVLCFANSF